MSKIWEVSSSGSSIIRGGSTDTLLMRLHRARGSARVSEDILVCICGVVPLVHRSEEHVIVNARLSLFISSPQLVVGVFSAYLQYNEDTLSLAIPATETHTGKTHTHTLNPIQMGLVWQGNKGNAALASGSLFPLILNNEHF